MISKALKRVKLELTDLPDDCIYEVLGFLFVKDMFSLGYTCEDMYRIVKSDVYWRIWLMRDFVGYGVKYVAVFAEDKLKLRVLKEWNHQDLEAHHKYKEVYKILYIGAKINLDKWKRSNFLSPKLCRKIDLWKKSPSMHYIEKYFVDRTTRFSTLNYIFQNYKLNVVKLKCGYVGHIQKEKCKNCIYDSRYLYYIGTIRRKMGFKVGSIYSSGRVVESGEYGHTCFFRLIKGSVYRVYRSGSNEGKLNRIKYKGRWKNGLYDGPGVLYELDETKTKNYIVKNGMFKNGIFVDGEMYEKKDTGYQLNLSCDLAARRKLK